MGQVWEDDKGRWRVGGIYGDKDAYIYSAEHGPTDPERTTRWEDIIEFTKTAKLVGDKS